MPGQLRLVQAQHAARFSLRRVFLIVGTYQRSRQTVAVEAIDIAARAGRAFHDHRRRLALTIRPVARPVDRHGDHMISGDALSPFAVAIAFRQREGVPQPGRKDHHRYRGRAARLVDHGVFDHAPFGRHFTGFSPNDGMRLFLHHGSPSTFKAMCAMRCMLSSGHFIVMVRFDRYLKLVELK